jgi:uncharacterized protein
VFASSNDPYIPIELSRNVAENTQAELFEIPNAGHFCKRDGYETFEVL